MRSLLAGAAKVNITPTVGIRLAGYGSRVQPSVGVHDDLWAQALVLDDGQRQVVLVTLDGLLLPADLAREVRTNLEREIGPAASDILLCATHTHSGPDLTVPDEKSTRYRAELSEKLQWAVGAAMQNRQPAQMWSSKGLFQEPAKNRRPMGGPMDPEVGVLGVETERKVPIAVLVNYTCHATVLGADNYLLSADYPGSMRRAIERRLGADVVLLFANGASGNINPGGYSPEVSMIGHYIPNRTFVDAERMGENLAAVVLQALKKRGPVAPPVVNSLSLPVTLSLKKRPDRHEAEDALAHQQQIVSQLKDAGAGPEARAEAEIELAYAELRLSLLEALEQAGGRETSAEIQAVRLGDTYLVGLPGEPFVEIGLEIKRRAGLDTFVAGLANAYLSYIPTANAYAEGGYEPAAAILAPGADEKIVSTALCLLSRLGTEQGRE